MWRDIRFAVHSLARSPIFTLAAVVGLGVAIGANATIFGLVDGLWFRPPGVRVPATLVRVFATTQSEDTGLWSWPEYETLRDTVSSFDGAVARGRRGAVMPAEDGSPELLLVNVVSSNFFSVLGVSPAHGRLFAPADDGAMEGQPGIVLGHAFWKRRFGGDPSVVGTTVNLDRGQRPLAVTILGVLPDSFRDLDAAADRDLWIPPGTWAQLANRSEFEARADRWFDIVARRREGVSVMTAQGEVGALASSLAQAFPETNAGRGARVQSDFDHRMEVGGVNARALLGLVLLVVGITCVNLANLLLARAAARGQELSMRVALGASRWRLLRQLMVENAVLGLAGALAGITLAMWLMRLLPSILITPPGFRSFTLFQVDARVFTFTLCVAVLTTLLFGVLPSWLAARADVAPLVKGDSRLLQSRAAERVMRNALVVVQVAVSLVLLCAAGVLTRSFIATGRADLGFPQTSVLTAWVSAADAPKAAAMEGVRSIEALPGVSRVAVAVRAPLSLSGNGMARAVMFPHLPQDPGAGLPNIKFNAVSANFFEVSGTRVIRGRPFEAADEREGEPVILVNEQFARQFFAGGDALGRTVRMGGAGGAEHRIVGIVQNAAINAIGEPIEPYLYLPYWRGQYGDITYFIESTMPAGDLGLQVRDALRRTHPGLDPRRLIPMAQYIEYSARTYRATATLATALGAIGLLLTALGVYGVIAYRTARRTREIGIRVALGAAHVDVLRMVLGEGARLGLLGVAVGIPIALVATRWMAAMLFGVGPWDVASFAGAAMVLLLTLMLATMVPALRATRITPSTALRDV
jgi:predicted permease